MRNHVIFVNLTVLPQDHTNHAIEQQGLTVNRNKEVRLYEKTKLYYREE